MSIDFYNKNAREIKRVKARTKNGFEKDPEEVGCWVACWVFSDAIWLFWTTIEASA